MFLFLFLWPWLPSYHSWNHCKVYKLGNNYGDYNSTKLDHLPTAKMNGDDFVCETLPNKAGRQHDCKALASVINYKREAHQHVHESIK